MTEQLHIRLLGALELTRGGTQLTLPPSKKTRALLGYLALTGRAHRRERLCELLWDVADDPRAALRWSLSKLRELVDHEGATRLVATRESVRLALDDVTLDVAEVKPLVGVDLVTLPTARLEAALACYRGELLEGLELPDFHAYYAFCLAEREALRGLHARILGELLARTMGAPDRALPLARRLVDLDPASESARASFLQLLHASGREREAALESQKSRRLLQSAPPAPLRDVAREETSTRESATIHERGPLPTLIGRHAELSRAVALLDAPRGARALLVTGEPGMGKSALFSKVVSAARPRVCALYQGGAHELDPGFPYAPLAALLREVELAPEPSAQGFDALAARERLLHAVTRALASQLEADERPVLLALEDLHWFDEASVVLLSHVLYACRDARLTVLLTARAGELADNAAARRLCRSLRSEGRLEELALGPLSKAETEALVRTLGADIDGVAVHAQSGGHPLFALELARAHATMRGVGSRDGVPPSITQLVRDRMEGLAHEPRELLRWASVLGTSFRVDALEPLLALDAVLFVEVLEQLEGRGWLALAPDAAGDSDARFSHDLVRRAIYDGLSEPRRRLMHGRIARRLAALSDPDGRLAAELARHAVLAGDAAMAVRACLSAGRRCLSLCATADALALAKRGLAHVTGLPKPDAVTLEIELRELWVLAVRPRPEEHAARLTELASEAIALRALAHARRCFFVQSLLVWEQGAVGDAQRFTREAERCSRLGGPRERLHGLGEAARCLAMLERDLPDAQAFVLEAEALLAGGEPEIAGVRLAGGLLALYRGALDDAARMLERAASLAQHEGDRLTEFASLEVALEVELSRGRWTEGEAIAKRMVSLAERLREGSELPFARAALLLTEVAREHGDERVLDEALDGLRAADAKQRASYLLVRYAEIELARGRLAEAAPHAREALSLAQRIERTTEVALANAVLAHVAHARGDASALAEIRLALTRLAAQPHLSARARGAVQRALTETGAEIGRGAGATDVEARREKDGARDRRARLR